jgi:hypothetical protein
MSSRRAGRATVQAGVECCNASQRPDDWPLFISPTLRAAMEILLIAASVLRNQGLSRLSNASYSVGRSNRRCFLSLPGTKIEAQEFLDR